MDKLPEKYQRDWADVEAKDKFTFDRFFQFLQDKGAAERTLRAKAQAAAGKKKSAGAASGAFLAVNPGPDLEGEGCEVCKDPAHVVPSCPAFLKVAPTQRKTIVGEKKLCARCLCKRHDGKCPTTIKCDRCQGPHHPLMHLAPAGKSAGKSAGKRRKPPAKKSA